MLTCFTWPAIMTSVMRSCFRMSISWLNWPSEIQWHFARQRFDLGRGLFLDADGHHFMPELARVLERQQREAAVAGDQCIAVAAHLFHEAALARADEGEQFVDLRRRRQLPRDPLQRLRGVQSRRASEAERPCASPRSTPAEKPRRSRPVLFSPKIFDSRGR